MPFLMSGRRGVPVMRRKLVETFELSERFESLEIPLYTAGRLEIWAKTWDEFGNFPSILAGTGQSLVETTFGPTYPHNLFLEIFLAGGLLALIPFVVFLFVLFRNMYVPFFEKRFDFFILAAVTGVFSMFSGDIAYNKVFFYFVGLAHGQLLRRSGCFWSL